MCRHYDPEAEAATDRLHRAMMELQDGTVQHVFAMRALLTPDQVQQFDRTADRRFPGEHLRRTDNSNIPVDDIIAYRTRLRPLGAAAAVLGSTTIANMARSRACR
jgi:hypothetical protein